MDTRYEHQTLADLWLPDQTIRWWTRIEKFVAQAQAEAGLIPQEAADAISAAPGPELVTVQTAERRTHHDVEAFVQSFATQVGSEHGRLVHLGLTSSDLVDTANAVRLKLATFHLAAEASTLSHELTYLGAKAKWRLGRTHGQAADPIPFSRQCQRLSGAVQRGLEHLQNNPVPMKLSGPVGTYAYNPPVIEESVARALSLPIDSFASQVVARDYYTNWAFGLVLLASAVEAVATEVRLSAQSDRAELAEGFSADQVGSTSMPHKRNPVRSERLCGLARVARGLFQPMLETTGALWNERDISNSSVERYALRHLTALVGWMLAECADLVRGLEVDVAEIDRGLLLGLGSLPTPAARLWMAVQNGVDRVEAHERIGQPDRWSMAATRELAWGGYADAKQLDWYGRNL